MSDIEKKIAQLEEELSVLPKIEEHLSTLHIQHENKELALVELAAQLEKEKGDIAKAEQRGFLDLFIQRDEDRAEKVAKESEEYFALFEQYTQAEAALDALEFEMQVLSDKQQILVDKEQELQKLLEELALAHLSPAAKHRLMAIKEDAAQLYDTSLQLQQLHKITLSTQQHIRKEFSVHTRIRSSSKKADINRLMAQTTDIVQIVRTVSATPIIGMHKLQQTAKQFIDRSTYFTDKINSYLHLPRNVDFRALQNDFRKIKHTPPQLQHDLEALLIHTLNAKKAISQQLLRIKRETNALLKKK